MLLIEILVCSKDDRSRNMDTGRPKINSWVNYFKLVLTPQTCWPQFNFSLLYFFLD